jgi:hypothetical protein
MSRLRRLRGKRSDQSGANTAITVAFVEIDVQMARIATAQWRKGRIIAYIGKPRIVRRIVQTTREISGNRTDFSKRDEEALDVIGYVAPQPALLERSALVWPQGLCRRTGGEENLLDRRQPGLPIRLIDQTNDARDKGPRIAGPAAVDQSLSPKILKRLHANDSPLPVTVVCRRCRQLFCREGK